ncbi:hypothetical protein [Paenirhodobacter sp.]|uniref:hypothetical protein n=1 Tax=Paenirhodobacter sp. TaxID=1965326 RepID=UPI003B3D67E0
MSAFTCSATGRLPCMLGKGGDQIDSFAEMFPEKPGTWNGDIGPPQGSHIGLGWKMFNVTAAETNPIRGLSESARSLHVFCPRARRSNAIRIPLGIRKFRLPIGG